jgi:RimJ/RimL family protein N-acetyltransferase
MIFNQDVFLKTGITEKQIDQLIQYTKSDLDVIKYTSDSKRFADQQSFNEWQKQGRIIYTLTDKHENLLGIVWFGLKDLPGFPKYNYTFGIRLYDLARGKGLSLPFLTEAVNQLSKLNLPITGFWLETAIDNLAAQKTYIKFGFQPIDYSADPSKIYMVKSV